jgi:hypothetical protein
LIAFVLRKIEWVVYATQSFGGSDAVLVYLSRYTHRIAIANRPARRLRRRARDLQMKGFILIGEKTSLGPIFARGITELIKLGAAEQDKP